MASSGSYVLPIAMTGIAMTVAAVIVGASIALKPPERDTATLCVKSGPTGQIVIVVDKSDTWSEVQAARLKTLVKGVAENLPVDMMLSIYVFSDVFEPGFGPLVSICNPGRVTNDIIGNQRRVEKRWRDQFGRPLDEAISLLLEPTEGRHSPIAEAMGDLLSRREISGIDGPRTLILVSDMLQNTSNFTFFGKKPSAHVPGEMGRLLDANLSGAEAWSVEVFQLHGRYDPERLATARTAWEPELTARVGRLVWQRL